MALTSDRPIIWGAAAVVVGGAIALYLYAHRAHPPAVPAPAPVALSAPPAAPLASTPSIEHPVPTASAATSAPPPLDQSDASVQAALIGLSGAQGLQKLLAPENIIRNIVVTVDNLSKKKVAPDKRPLKATAGEFKTRGTGSELTISPENYARYQPFIEVVKGIDTDQLVQLYYRLYPLFQSAYDDLGYPNSYFNDRLIALIDHLLATPDVTGPVALVQPNVMYLYADPALEALSAGQKTLIRMGPANEAVVKARLRELKGRLLAQPRPRT